ncbi:MAG: hypothetical protein RL247_83 [Actinomycetota bacterium]|jgi:uncharacterized protein (DUF427 family)
MHSPVESVWDYPRPPRVEPSTEHIVVTHRGFVIAETTASFRVLETSHPPTYYLPFDCVDWQYVETVAGSTWCEFKGAASYADIVVGSSRIARAIWWYPSPATGYEMLADHLSLYPGKVDSVTVAGEEVQAQEGDFYGGWITSRVRGPFKGAPGTAGW